MDKQMYGCYEINLVEGVILIRKTGCSNMFWHSGEISKVYKNILFPDVGRCCLLSKKDFDLSKIKSIIDMEIKLDLRDESRSKDSDKENESLVRLLRGEGFLVN